VQFGSWAFTKRARDSSLLASISSTVECYDNFMIESFWSRMQVELLDWEKWNTRLELAHAIFEYLEIWTTVSADTASSDGSLSRAGFTRVSGHAGAVQCWTPGRHLKPTPCNA